MKVLVYYSSHKYASYKQNCHMAATASKELRNDGIVMTKTDHDIKLQLHVLII